MEATAHYQPPPKLQPWNLTAYELAVTLTAEQGPERALQTVCKLIADGDTCSWLHEVLRLVLMGAQAQRRAAQRNGRAQT